MKKLLTALYMSCALVLGAQTNVYHQMADTAASWCETRTWGLCGAVEDHVLFMNGDTVIGANTYQKLYATGHYYCPWPPQNFFTNELRGYCREDTAARRVYYVEAISPTVEYLRYDWNWTVGDTAEGDLGGADAIVTSMDSVLVGSDYRKRWWLNSGMFMDSACVVEGIGSSFGFYWMDIQSVESISRLLSYSEYGNVLWYPGGFANCPVITGGTAHPLTQPLYWSRPILTKDHLRFR